MSETASSGPQTTNSTNPTPPVMFVDWPLPRQVWESVGGAVVVGVISGLLLAVTWWAYLIGVAVSFIGGAPSGGQHRTLLGAVARGFVGGTAWAASVYATSELTGATPTVELPTTVIAFLPWGFIPAVVVAIGSWLVARRRADG